MPKHQLNENWNFNRRNRDRRGGHESRWMVLAGDFCFHTPIERKTLKALITKRDRREGQRELNQVVREHLYLTHDERVEEALIAEIEHYDAMDQYDLSDPSYYGDHDDDHRIERDEGIDCFDDWSDMDALENWDERYDRAELASNYNHNYLTLGEIFGDAA